MVSAFHSKFDVGAYLAAFSSNDFAAFAAYYDPAVTVRLNANVKLEGKDRVVSFFKEQRKVMNENIEAHHIILDDTGCAIRATATFTARVDMDSGYFGMPPIKAGQGYKMSYIILYVLTGENEISEVVAARLGEAEIVEAA